MSSGAAPPLPSPPSGGDRGSYINGSIWAMQSLAGLFLGLRVYCKLSRRRGLWWDDYFLIASWILLLVSAASTSSNVHLGFGKHFQEVDLGNLELMGILSLLSGFFSILSAVASKTSFAMTLLRLTDGWLKRIIWAIIVSMNVLMPLSALFLFVDCNPVAKNWKPDLPGKCWPGNVSVVYGIVVGAYTSGCDLALALLPWRILMRFRMYRREKIGVAVAMSMGVFACATGIVKCVMLPLLSNPDFTYDGAPFVVWGFAECAVLIMAASIPALRALFNEVRGAPHFIQRMLPSLRLSPTAVTPSKPPDGSDGSNGSSNATSVLSTPGHDEATSPGGGRGDAASAAHNSTYTKHSHLTAHTTIASHISTRSSQRAAAAAAEAAASAEQDRKRDDTSSDKSILARSGLSTAEVAFVETTDAGEAMGEHDIEMNTHRHSYNLQDV
ncbi:hypothetical protein SPI_02400 [Niveomyces insectorum RCEF 264]|uniref:Rhodopsin domain-containing protein n=1 Tax=Niveomyces insectorum RCEF 264 TaxID=1081102 RepID=A0A167XZ85_9HYPO|nr:hypothetical protein SPI_02400 [Niveomyces insectorum RCEF 264]